MYILFFIKVNSGVLKAGDDVYVGKGVQRVSMLYQMTGKKLDAIQEVHAGDIAAITRLEGVASGTPVFITGNKDPNGRVKIYRNPFVQPPIGSIFSNTAETLFNSNFNPGNIDPIW